MKPTAARDAVDVEVGLSQPLLLLGELPDGDGVGMGFLDDDRRCKARQRDRAAYRRGTLEEFSGTLCGDEIPWGV